MSGTSIPYAPRVSCDTPGMASYAVVSNNPVAMGNTDVLAVVVTDGRDTIVVPSDDPVGLSDVEWDTGAPEDVLRAGLASLSYFTVDGPHTFEGDAAGSIAALARSYGLA